MLEKVDYVPYLSTFGTVLIADTTNGAITTLVFLVSFDLVLLIGFIIMTVYNSSVRRRMHAENELNKLTQYNLSHVYQATDNAHTSSLLIRLVSVHFGFVLVNQLIFIYATLELDNSDGIIKFLIGYQLLYYVISDYF